MFYSFLFIYLFIFHFLFIFFFIFLDIKTHSSHKIEQFSYFKIHLMNLFHLQLSRVNLEI